MMITIEALKHDGHCYRYCRGDLVHASPSGWVVDCPPGTEVVALDGQGWVQENFIRTYLPASGVINLLEVSNPDGEGLEIYINIASKPLKSSRVIQYVDYEIDVTRDLVEKSDPQIIDLDEFEEAKLKYGYSDELIEDCARGSQLAAELAENWRFGSDPNETMEFVAKFLSGKKFPSLQVEK